MKNYKVTYSGNASKFKNFEKEVYAETEREAVEEVYASVMDENYFPEKDGTIRNSSGDIIADADDNSIRYDGGYFNAELKTDDKTFDVVFNNDDSSNEKGFADSKEYCIDYIKSNNGTNESYFENYKGGTVQVVCDQTGEVVYEEVVR